MATLRKFYLIKFLCLVGAGIALIFALIFLRLNLDFSQIVFVWSLISLAFDYLIFGKIKVHINSSVSNNARKLPANQWEHFVTMRKAKVIYLSVSFAGTLVGFPFFYSYFVLSLGWMIYIYALKDNKSVSAFFEKCQPLSAEELEEISKRHDSWNESRESINIFSSSRRGHNLFSN